MSSVEFRASAKCQLGLWRKNASKTQEKVRKKKNRKRLEYISNASGRLFVLMFVELEMRKVFGQQKSKRLTRGNTVLEGE